MGLIERINNWLTRKHNKEIIELEEQLGGMIDSLVEIKAGMEQAENKEEFMKNNKKGVEGLIKKIKNLLNEYFKTLNKIINDHLKMIQKQEEKETKFEENQAVLEGLMVVISNYQARVTSLFNLLTWSIANFDIKEFSEKFVKKINERNEAFEQKKKEIYDNYRDTLRNLQQKGGYDINIEEKIRELQRVEEQAAVQTMQLYST